VFIDPPRFSLDNIGQAIDDYMIGAQNLDDDDWSNIYKLCGLGRRPVADKLDKQLSMNRRSLFAGRKRS
jgi:hypothetical protein